jgi:hypothetical protein
MGIDRIGKGGSVPPPTQAPATQSAQRPEAPFAMPGASAPSAASSTAASGASPLSRLRSGEIDVHAYLDIKVDQATAQLKGLGGEELQFVRSALREQIASDPTLADLFEQATGSAASRVED